MSASSALCSSLMTIDELIAFRRRVVVGAPLTAVWVGLCNGGGEGMGEGRAWGRRSGGACTGLPWRARARRRVVERHHSVIRSMLLQLLG